MDKGGAAAASGLGAGAGAVAGQAAAGSGAARGRRRDDTTTKLLNNVNSGGHLLLRSCVSLAEALPVTPLNASADWPVLLGRFKAVAQHLDEVARQTERQLEHWVPVPVEPAAAPDGRPTMVVPQLLRTKKPPEQEIAERRVRKQVQDFLPEAGGDKAKREEEAAVRLNGFTNVVHNYNTAVDAVIDGLRKSDATKALKRKADETVTQFAAKKRATKPVDGIDLFAYLYTGKHP